MRPLNEPALHCFLLVINGQISPSIRGFALAQSPPNLFWTAPWTEWMRLAGARFSYWVVLIRAMHRASRWVREKFLVSRCCRKLKWAQELPWRAEFEPFSFIAHPPPLFFPLSWSGRMLPKAWHWHHYVSALATLHVRRTWTMLFGICFMLFFLASFVFMFN